MISALVAGLPAHGLAPGDFRNIAMRSREPCHVKLTDVWNIQPHENLERVGQSARMYP